MGLKRGWALFIREKKSLGGTFKGGLLQELVDNVTYLKKNLKLLENLDTIFKIIIETKLNLAVNQKCQFAWKKTSSLFMVIVHLGAGRDLNVGRLEVAATINDATTKNNSIKKIASLFPT